MKKRIVSLMLILIMALGMMGGISMETLAESVSAPIGALYVNPEWSAGNTPSAVTYMGQSVGLSWNDNAFGSAQEALDSAENGDTIVLLAGTYGAMTIKKSVTILGAKAGINPNAKNPADEFSAWTLNEGRGNGETVVNGIIFLGVSGDTIYNNDITVTIDGIQLTGSGQLRSNAGKAGKAKLTFKNIYVKNHTGTTEPIYLYPAYSASVNEYVKDVTIQNIRFEGQTTINGFKLNANKLDIGGVFMGADCTMIFADLFSAAKYKSGMADIEWKIHDSMFLNPIYRVIYANWDSSSAINSTIGSYGKVTTTFENNYFINSFAADKAYTLAFRQNTLNTYYNFIGNTFYHSTAPASNHVAIAGYSTVNQAYGAQIKLEKNRFIGNIVTCWNYGASTTKVDISGNYYENKDGKVNSITASGSNHLQDWWYLDRACTKKSNGVLDDVAPELIFDLEKDVKWFGRTYIEDNKHYFNWTNSGFEVNFNGTGLWAMLYSNNPGGVNTAYLKIYVDGEHTQTIQLNSAAQLVQLAQNLKPGYHTVRVVKRTNGRSSTAALGNLWLDEGASVALPNESSSRKMQFVGDSITVGYGSLNPNNETTWSTSTEDGTITYAALTAQYFGAENHTIAVSGRGIVKNTGGDSNDIAPLMYEYSDWNKKTVKWDHSQYEPDVIVVNYGTNDHSHCTESEFKVGCKAFVEQVRADNPNAYIIYAYGFMGEKYKTVVSEVVAELNAAGDQKVYYHRLAPITAAEKSIGHPNGAAHVDRAQGLIETVARVTGWQPFGECRYQDTELQKATCEQMGVIKHTCIDCGKVYTSEVSGHIKSEEIIVDTAPTCVATGVGHKNCTLCGEVLERDIVIAKDENAHKADDEVIVDTAPTCSDTGIGHKNCALCGEIAERDIVIDKDKDVHTDWELIVEEYPTTTQSGKGHMACIGCGIVGQRDIVIDPLGKVSIGVVSYDTLEAALVAAKEGQTVKIHADVEADWILLNPEVTLDLNGHTLTTDYVVALKGSALIDSSAENTGKLVTDKDAVVLDKRNEGYLAVYDAQNGCYLFTNVAMRQTFMAADKYVFSPVFETFVHTALAAAESSGVKVVVRISWTKDTYVAIQDFKYKDEFVTEVIESYGSFYGHPINDYGKAFAATYKRMGADIDEMSICAVVVSETGTEIVSESLPLA